MTEKKTKQKWVMTSNPADPTVGWKRKTVFANQNIGLEEARMYARKEEIYQIERDLFNIMVE